jgi:Uma2 family endonuclease
LGSKFIGDPAEERDLGVAIMAPVGVFMPACDPVQPDFVFIRKANLEIIRDRRIFGAPDLIVEVLSPNNAAFDERIKLIAYAGASLPEYATVSPAARTLSLYRLDAPGRYHSPRVFKEAEPVSFGCLPEITFPVSELFAGSPDTTL